MTMNITKGELIAGVSAWELRKFFRELRSWHRQRFSSRELENHFALDEIREAEVGENLLSEGYV